MGGARYLGGFVGSTSLRDAHVEAKISDWVYAIERLALVAKHRRSQSAFSGLTKVLQHQWTYLQRVTPGIDAHSRVAVSIQPNTPKEEPQECSSDTRTIAP